MTEDEAKTKWCPASRIGYSGTTVAGMNRIHEINVGEKAIGCCLGSGCMAWRWGQVEETKDGQHPHDWPEMARYHAHDTTRRFKRHGYCGLAGPPIMPNFND